MRTKVLAEDGQAAVKRTFEAIADLHTVRTAKIQCEAVRPLKSDSVSLLTSLAVGSELVDGALLTQSTYNVAAVDDEGDEATAENTVWSVEVVLIAQWNLLPDASVTPLDAQCFAIGNGALACHPYARECVQSMTARMNYPQATLDVIFNPWAGNDEVMLEVGSE